MADKKTEFEGKRVFVFTRDGWEFVERKSAKEAVAIIAVTDDRKLVLTEQYRRPVDRRVIDIPAGLIGDEGDTNDPGETARKELAEETGFTCSAIERVAFGPSSPGITSELVHLYRASGLTKRSEGGGVGDEDITVHTVPLREITEWLRDKERDGVLIDLKVWSALYFSA
jgi:ADP-ribose pyrophosphatase